MLVGGRPALDHWLLALRNCTWLKPLQQKLYIVCDSGQYSTFQTWAEKSLQAQQSGFLGGKQILAAQLGSSVQSDQLAPMSAIAPSVIPTDMLIFNYAASLCEPEFDMHRFIQHALVRNKDTVAFSSAPGSEQLNQQFLLQLQGGLANPQVTRMTHRPAGMSSSDPVVCGYHAATVFAIRGTSISTLQQSNTSSLCAAFQTLMASEGVYGLPVQCSFDLSTLDGYLYAAAFFDFYQQHWKLLHSGEDKAEGVPSQVLAIATEQNLDCIAQA